MNRIKFKKKFSFKNSMIFYRYLFNVHNILNFLNNKVKSFYDRKYSYLNNIIYLFYNIDIL